MKFDVTKNYADGGFELRWREGPRHCFTGVTSDSTFGGHQNDAVHYDDGYGSCPFQNPPGEAVVSLDEVEEFGRLNAWMLAWWPRLCLLSHPPVSSSFKDLPPLEGPWPGLIPTSDGTLTPGHLTIIQDAHAVTVKFIPDDGPSRSVQASLVAHFRGLDYLELRLAPSGQLACFVMLDLWCVASETPIPVLTESPDLDETTRYAKLEAQHAVTAI